METYRTAGHYNSHVLDFYRDIRNWLFENLGEIESQHQAEVNHYGDSWPGAQVQIAERREDLAKFDALYDQEFSDAEGYGPWPDQKGPDQKGYGFDDIPF